SARSPAAPSAASNRPPPSDEGKRITPPRAPQFARELPPEPPNPANTKTHPPPETPKIRASQKTSRTTVVMWATAPQHVKTPAGSSPQGGRAEGRRAPSEVAAGRAVKGWAREAVLGFVKNAGPRDRGCCMGLWSTSASRAASSSGWSARLMEKRGLPGFPEVG